jgi:thiol-disulfide isomerase/thioredoxin
MKIAATVTCLIALAGAVPALGQATILRESTGQRLADLDRMELTAFPAANWSLLSQWANGEALDSAATDGNVVLIFTWSNWNPGTIRGLPMIQRLAADNEGKGLIVVGAHHKDGWEGAVDAATKAGVTFRYAHDSGNAFRAALKVDNDPDFYLIDRAGQLRYADIQTQSVTSAVNELVAETREHAAGENDRRKADAAKRAADAKLTGKIREGIDLASLPEMDVPRQPAEAYLKAEWPERWKEFETQALRMSQFSGAAPEVKVLELPKVGSQGIRWFDAQPNINGRAIVVYFWCPDVYASYSETQPQMDALQKQKGRDIAVIGVVVPRRNENQVYVPTPEENEKARVKFLEMAEVARTKRKYDHANVIDPDYSVLQLIVGANGMNQGIPVPLAAIFSSDMTLRWIGPPTDSRFNTALEKVLRVDPAVIERRSMEQAYIRTHGG